MIENKILYICERSDEEKESDVMFRILKEKPFITTLDSCHNDIGDTGTKLLVSGLK